MKALGVIRAFMLAAGLGALVAAAMSWISVLVVGGVRPPWSSSLQIFGLEIALALIPAAIVAWVLMPRAADVSLPVPSDEPAAAALPLPLLLAGLAVAALLQAPSVAAWWTADRALLTQAMGSARDPLGLNLVPTIVVLSLPSLAALTLLTCVLTSLLGILMRRERALPALGACAALLAGLVSTLHLVLHAIRTLGSTVQNLMAAGPDAKAAAQVADWILRHDAAGMNVSWRLVWLLGGYIIAVALAAVLRARRHPANAPLRTT